MGDLDISVSLRLPKAVRNFNVAAKDSFLFVLPLFHWIRMPLNLISRHPVELKCVDECIVIEPPLDESMVSNEV